MRSDSQMAVKGVLWSSRGRWFVVRQAELLSKGAPPAPIDGEVVIDRDNVAFMQVLPS